jgi:stearoyl-CoA desaturase (Delta-9 desaturase)
MGPLITPASSGSPTGRQNFREAKLRRRLRIHSIVVIGGSTAGALAALVWFPPGRLDVLLLIISFTISGIGISVGYHRLLAHRAFDAKPALRYTLLAMGATAGQGPPSYWVILHRLHHRFSDREGDPHSPSAGFPERSLRGFAHAHVGWIHKVAMPKGDKECSDVHCDASVRRIGRLYIPILATGILLPAGVGYWLGGSLSAAIAAMLWAGAVRLVFVHHVVWSVNSICHQLGRHPYKTSDHSGNVWWLALVSFGESWHNNHHAAAGSARFGLEWWQLDLGYLFIRCCGIVGLAPIVRVTTARALLSRRASA